MELKVNLDTYFIDYKILNSHLTTSKPTRVHVILVYDLLIAATVWIVLHWFHMAEDQFIRPQPIATGLAVVSKVMNSAGKTFLHWTPLSLWNCRMSLYFSKIHKFQWIGDLRVSGYVWYSWVWSTHILKWLCPGVVCFVLASSGVLCPLIRNDWVDN